MVEPDTSDDDDLPRVSRPKRRIAGWLALSSAALALGLAGLGAQRLSTLQDDELALETEPQSLRRARALPTATRLSARLAQAALRRDQRAVFELCAMGSLSAPAFRDAFEVLILRANAGQLMLRVPLDEAHLQHVQSDGQYSCLHLGSGVIEHTDTYRIEAVWPKQPPPDAAQDVDLWVHIQASPELARADRTMVLGLGASILLTLVLLLRALPRTTTGQRERALPTTHSGKLAAHISPIAALGLMYLAMQWPSQGGLSTLYKGALLLAIQLGLPLVLATHTREPDGAAGLGLLRVGEPARAAVLTVACVPVLVAAARLSLRIVPSTGVAPIQTFIAWPSGMLSAALLGVLLPLGEEMFFRGYLLGVWQRHGRALGAILSVAAFGLMHLEQSWGNWGGLLAIFMTGSVLCALRLVTGSTLLPAVSHVAYNLTLSASTLAAATVT